MFFSFKLYATCYALNHFPGKITGFVLTHPWFAVMLIIYRCNFEVNFHP
jgi:hypothetical protein